MGGRNREIIMISALERFWQLLAAPGGSWRLPAVSGPPRCSRRLSAAPGGSWRPLEATGGYWRLLTLLDGGSEGSWRLLEAPGRS